MQRDWNYVSLEAQMKKTMEGFLNASKTNLTKLFFAYS
jgi:hypothetical protein